MTLLRFAAVSTLLLGTSAGAAGLLATAGAVSTSTFCQQYGCALLDQSGRTWTYELRRNGAQLLEVQRESSDPGSRITTISLHSFNDDVNADLDRSTFAAVQGLAMGFVSNTGRLENCYALDGSQYRVLATSPDDRTARIYCDWDPAYTRFVIEADPGYLARTAPSAATLTGGPTKLNVWSFRSCKSAAGVNTYLTRGQAARCDLVIETKGAQSALVRAEFQYEIEYVQGGQYVKKLLPEKEVWLPTRTPGPLDPRVTQQGRTITANLSLAVKDVPGRRVTSMNTIARLTFANGAVKTAYEPLLVR
ncbi:hypothetical protein [Deinococcus multiflagellatus]|uniref:Uncharacterized protein n=1 Tax=Deinococcus multiflagellatus TaxID=1656887 RepID=A0ABW1ZJA8_9DEIO|nr:hypothetical protein [Deinococcus multiflagellatus]MBZ9714359.1 hypothetical protein [Deinococcus multiflagellatus]